MAIQGLKAELKKQFQKLGYQEQNSRFLFSCISEGVIPQGLQFNFSLAKFVNDREIISKIQQIMDDSNSRLLDLILSSLEEALEIKAKY